MFSTLSMTRMWACFALGFLCVGAPDAVAKDSSPQHPLDKACLDGNAAACCQRLQGQEVGNKDPERSKDRHNRIDIDLRGRFSAPKLSDGSTLATGKPMKVVVKAAPGLPVVLTNGNGKAAELVRGVVPASGEVTLRIQRFDRDARLFSSGICKTRPKGLRVSPKPLLLGALGNADGSTALTAALESKLNGSALQKTLDESAAKLKRGRSLYDSSCKACHSLDGTKLVGPTFRNLANSTVELSDGRKVKADAAYIRRAIVEPHKDVRKGYPPAMPPFRRADADIDALVFFIQTQHD